jgi:hypothetical protein
MYIAIEEVVILGIEYRKESAFQFCSGKAQRLTLQCDSANPHDFNAIQIIGHFQYGGVNQSAILGYIPAKIAASIVSEGKDYVADVLLNRVWISEDGFIKIVCDIIYPKPELQEIDNSCAPASRRGAV